MAADHSIISLGYNGGPSKGKSCLKGECPRGRLTKEELPGDSAYDTGGGTCVALHAEWNVIIRTAHHQFANSTLYITDEPCHICKVLISGTAIQRVVAPGYEWHRTEVDSLLYRRGEGDLSDLPGYLIMDGGKPGFRIRAEDLELQDGSESLVREIRQAQHDSLINGLFPDDEDERRCDGWADGHSSRRCTKLKNHEDPHG